MPFSVVAGHDATISGVESEVYESFFNDAFSAEYLGAEILLSPKYQEQVEGTCDVHDHSFTSLSYVELIDAEEDCFLVDTTKSESQGVVEVPALPKLNPRCNELSVLPSGSLLGSCLPSYPKDYTTTSPSSLNHGTDTKDCFQRPVPWLSASSTENFYTDGLVPDLAAPSYDRNYSLVSFTTTGADQAGNMDSCPSTEYHMSPVWPEINHSKLQDSTHSMDFVLDEILGTPRETDLLVVGGIASFRHPNLDLILRQDPIFAAKSQRYDAGCGGRIPNAFATNDQYLPVEHRSRINNPRHLSEGSCRADVTAALSYVESNLFECHIADAVNQINTSDNCLILQPGTSYYLPAGLSLRSSLTLLQTRLPCLQHL